MKWMEGMIYDIDSLYVQRKIQTIIIGLRSFGSSRLRVTWARPRIRNSARRFDPNMKCYKCGQRGHFG